MSSTFRKHAIAVALAALYVTPPDLAFAQVSPGNAIPAVKPALKDEGFADFKTVAAEIERAKAKAKEAGFPVDIDGITRIAPKGDGQFRISNKRGYLDFDKNGQLMRGEIKNEDGKTT